MTDAAAPTPEAVQACRDDCADNPKNAPLRFELGQMLRAIGDLAGAADEYEAALALKPNYSRASKALDEIRSGAPSDPPPPPPPPAPEGANGSGPPPAGGGADAAPPAERSDRGRRKQSSASFIFGSMLAKSGDHNRACEFLAKAREEDPSDPKAHFNLARSVALRTEPPADLDEAIACYEAGLACCAAGAAPAEARADLAGLLIRQGRAAEAVAQCESALAATPRGALPNRHASYNLNTALRHAGEQARAIEATWRFLAPRVPRAALDGGGEAARARASADAPPPPPLTVACVKWGTKYSSEYVLRLARGVRRHLRRDAAFVCFTDDASGLEGDGVEARALPRETPLHSWWLKAWLFSADARLAGRVLYIDLDTVVVGALDELAGFDGAFGTLATDGMVNERRAGGYNSSVMMWTAGEFDAIYARLRADFEFITAHIYKFDHWLEMVVADAHLLDAAFPGQIAEWKAHAREPHANARIVTFPLAPKPHEVADEPMLVEHWR